MVFGCQSTRVVVYSQRSYLITVLIERTKSLPINATATAVVVDSPIKVIIAVVLYPAPGSTMSTATTWPALLIIAVIAAGVTHSPVTTTSGALKYPLPPLTRVTLCMPSR